MKSFLYYWFGCCLFFFGVTGVTYSTSWKRTFAPGSWGSSEELGNGIDEITWTFGQRQGTSNILDGSTNNWVTFRASPQSSRISERLYFDHFDFGSQENGKALPDSSTINGLEMIVTGSTLVFYLTPVVFDVAAFQKDGRIQQNPSSISSNLGANTQFLQPNSPGTISFGGPTNKWGYNNLNPDLIKNPNWGTFIRWKTVEPYPYSHITYEARIHFAEIVAHYSFTTGVASINPVEKQGLDGNFDIQIYATGNFSILSSFSDIQCRVGDAPGNVVAGFSPIGSPPYLTCRVPPQTAYGQYQVAFSLGGNSWTTEDVKFRYYLTKTCTPPCVRGTCDYGTCICPSGWIGQVCNIPDCSQQPYNNCTGNGLCVGPNTCSCSDGWTGSGCEIAICSDGCNEELGVGSCLTPDQCECDDGFLLPNCKPSCFPPFGNSSDNCGNVSITHQICLYNQGGINYCVCEPGWSGEDCQINTNAICSKCENGLCIDDEVCKCNRGWKGDFCDEAVCPDDCNSPNGNCIAPNLCSCEEGWFGNLCTQPNCTAVQDCNLKGDCIAPNTCVCKDGYDGPSCTPICLDCEGNCIAPGVCVCPGGEIPPSCTNVISPPNCEQVNNCSSKGICLGENICFCDPEWSGADCSIPLCPDRNCEKMGHGFCVSPNQCQCDDEWFGIECELGPEQKGVDNLSKESSGIGLILGAVFSSFGVCLVGSLVLFIIYRKKRRGFHVIEIKEPKWRTLIFGKYLDKLYTESEKKNFSEFEGLLLNDDLNLIRGLSKTADGQEQEDISKSLIFIFESHNRTLSLIKAFISHEIDECHEKNNLFRGNSFTTKLFKNYSRTLALPYLFNCLADVIAGIILETKEEGPNEINPSKVEEGVDMTANKWQLLLSSQRIFTAIVRSVESIPSPLRELSLFVANETSKKYENYVDRALGGLWFLRFYCPALTAPHLYGLTIEPLSDDVQRQFILLSKILQNLANGVVFGNKEAGMERLNDFINDNKETLSSFFSHLINIELKGNESLMIPPRVKQNSLCSLHSIVTKNFEKMKETLDEKTKQELQRILKDLGPPLESTLSS